LPTGNALGIDKVHRRLPCKGGISEVFRWHDIPASTHVVLIDEMPEVKFLFTTHRQHVRFCLFEIRFVHDSMLWPDKATPLLSFGTNPLGQHD